MPQALHRFDGGQTVHLSKRLTDHLYVQMGLNQKNAIPRRSERCYLKLVRPTP